MVTPVTFRLRWTGDPRNASQRLAGFELAVRVLRLRRAHPLPRQLAIVKFEELPCHRIALSDR